MSASSEPIRPKAEGRLRPEAFLHLLDSRFASEDSLHLDTDHLKSQLLEFARPLKGYHSQANARLPFRQKLSYLLEGLLARVGKK